MLAEMVVLWLTSIEPFRENDPGPVTE